MPDRLSTEDRTLIDQAVAAGRITHVAPMHACGISVMEKLTGVIAWAGIGATTPWRVPKAEGKA